MPSATTANYSGINLIFFIAFFALFFIPFYSLFLFRSNSDTVNVNALVSFCSNFVEKHSTSITVVVCWENVYVDNDDDASYFFGDISRTVRTILFIRHLNQRCCGSFGLIRNIHSIFPKVGKQQVVLKNVTTAAAAAAAQCTTIFTVELKQMGCAAAFK